MTAGRPKLRDVTLDNRSLPHLDQVLRDGGDLSHAVLDRLVEGPRQVHTLLPADLDADAAHLLPADLDVEAAYLFRHAMISVSRSTTAEMGKQQVGAVFEALLDTVIRHLRSGSDAIVLLEHIWGSATDGWIRKRNVDFVIQGKGVLVYVTPKTLPGLSKSSLATTVRTSTMLYMCALVRDSDWPKWLIRGQAVSAGRLRRLTRGHFTAIIGAYDGEGYIYLELG